jgi:DNA adenine methylase
LYIVALGTLQSPLKYAGGKRHLVPKLAQVYDAHRHCRLVEPFVGGMSVALGLQPMVALLADVNPHLINFYAWLRRGLVIDEVEMANDELRYYFNRDRFNELIQTDAGRHGKEAAALFYFLNRTGFNGLCRFNRSGQFNVPFGKYRTIAYRRDFTEYKAMLVSWTLARCDFRLLDDQLGPNDFLYCDPPYDTPFTTYSAGGFDWDDQVALAQWAAKHPGPVVASNQATDRIVALYQGLGYTIEIIDAPRRISCKGDRTPAKEIFASRNL